MSPLECLAVLCLRRVYGGSCKTCRFRKCHVSKLEDVSHEMLVLRLPHVSSWVSGFFLPSQCLSFLFEGVKVSKLEGLARNARFDAPACLVFSLWFSSTFALSMGKAAKPFRFGGIKASFHVVLRGRSGTS